MNAIVNSNQRLQHRRSPRAQNNATRQRPTGLSGNAHKSYERYLTLAREAASKGDTIEMENCYQHAEHYFRLLRERST